MKVLLISTSDIEGGAARAAYRLHQGFQTVGINSQMLVQAKASDDQAVFTSSSSFSKVVTKLKLTEHTDTLVLKRYSRSSKALFSPQWVPDRVANAVTKLNPEIINLHWTCKGFLKVETVSKFRKPIVWTLHDMWAFTGGCHYTEDCDRYTKLCGSCPQLQSDRDRDLSRWVLQRKARAWKDVNLTIVTPSSWLAKCARASSLFQNTRVEVISNGLDIRTYKPCDRTLARQWLNLRQDKKLVLFGAALLEDSRKGFALLEQALMRLGTTEHSDEIELVMFGSAKPSYRSLEQKFKVHYLGRFNDDVSLALVYAAVDVFVAPSLQDNLPNTVLEALSCGTPCVGFEIGGMPDLIEHQQNGYLAQPFDVDDLAQGIVWVLQNSERHQKLCDRARQKAEQDFTLERQADQYTALFKELLDVDRTKATIS
ncbi:MAG: glycosyl transferase [Leptolyngbya sp. ERB_1_1]